jgi:hypothetical protein
LTTLAEQHRYRDAIRQWVSTLQWTHFVTLQFNDPMRRIDQMRKSLFHWDACCNKRLLGKRWRAKPDERLLWIAFAEKMADYPHWHLVLQVLPDQIDAFANGSLDQSLEEFLARRWTALGPSFTCDVQVIESIGAVDYVTKLVGKPESLTNFVHSREANRH